MAAAGPLLVAASVKITVLPRLGALLLTLFNRVRSASELPGVELAELFHVAMSSSVPEMVAELENRPAVLTVVVICREEVAPLAILPTVHIPVPGT